jgi:hypothetical protein
MPDIGHLAKWIESEEDDLVGKEIEDESVKRSQNA